MEILDRAITLERLQTVAEDSFGGMVKAVVDVDRDKMALNADLHADLEALLLENGSSQKSLWGINLHPGLPGDDFLEFDSMINMRPSQGNTSRGVDDHATREKIRAIVNRWIER